MKITRRQFVAAASLPLLGLSALNARADVPAKDYTLVDPPQPTDNPAKIEVIEFFSYGCPHCAEMAPEIEKWRARQGADVVFRRLPVSFGRAPWANVGKLYYALETTGDLARLDSLVFVAIHKERAQLFDDKSIAEWVAKQGVNPKAFADAYNSFGVASKMQRAQQLVQAYRIDGVPALVVDGRYKPGGASHEQALSITDALIAQVRAQKGKK